MTEDKKLLRVAIDGPSGSGKSTVAKLIAKEYGIDYVDTGAMYRAMGLKIKRTGITCEEGPEMDELLESTVIDFSGNRIFLDGEDVSELIRTQEISMMASECSALPSVRNKLATLQQEMGASKSVVMDGRDICSVVMPDAEYKFFVTATPEERAMRRYKELIGRGENPEYETILKEINERDYNDTHRDVNPLKQTEDAVLVDTTEMDIDQVVSTIKGIIGDR